MNMKKAMKLALGILVGVSALAAVSTLPVQARPINCKIVSCPAPACLDNEHLQVPPGQCCPVCVPN
jgi:hypothetical protein